MPSSEALPQRISILGGSSVEKLERLVAINCPPNCVNLDVVRSWLKGLGFMSSTDSFLDSSDFPIYRGDEKSIPTVEVLQDPSDLPEKDAPGSKGDRTKAKKANEYPLLRILSGLSAGEPTKNPKLIDQFKMSHSDRDQPADGKISKPQVDLSNIPTIPKAKPSKDGSVNAKTLSKNQIDDVFEINNIFGGISFIGPIGACSQIFEPPSDLPNMIWVYDDASIEVQDFESSTMNSMFKQGAWGISGELGFKGAVIRLPLASLQPTEKFQKELDAAFADLPKDIISNPGTSKADIVYKYDYLKRARLTDFFAQYGQAFAFDAQLGGHLYTTVLLKKTTADTIETSKSQVKAGFALDFGLGKSLGISGNHESASKSEQASDVKYSDFVIEAVGGDTLLSSDLELWPSSVMPHTNWRITRRANIQALIDISSLFSEERKAEVERLFKFGNKSLPLPLPPPPPPPPAPAPAPPPPMVLTEAPPGQVPTPAKKPEDPTNTANLAKSPANETGGWGLDRL
ncbi:hypothetical protein FRC09_010224 [Ceratobasidium sp. 395]|nr:hypothetical protein FRC09_010224 [Ceratobasidium sp. 395]